MISLVFYSYYIEKRSTLAVETADFSFHQAEEKTEKHRVIKLFMQTFNRLSKNCGALVSVIAKKMKRLRSCNLVAVKNSETMVMSSLARSVASYGSTEVL